MGVTTTRLCRLRALRLPGELLSVQTLEATYQQADAETILRVVLEDVEFREA